MDDITRNMEKAHHGDAKEVTPVPESYTGMCIRSVNQKALHELQDTQAVKPK
jgi:hypothetical protein